MISRSNQRTIAISLILAASNCLCAFARNHDNEGYYASIGASAAQSGPGSKASAGYYATVPGAESIKVEHIKPVPVRAVHATAEAPGSRHERHEKTAAAQTEFNNWLFGNLKQKPEKEVAREAEPAPSKLPPTPTPESKPQAKPVVLSLAIQTNGRASKTKPDRHWFFWHRKPSEHTAATVAEKPAAKATEQPIAVAKPVVEQPVRKPGPFDALQKLIAQAAKSLDDGATAIASQLYAQAVRLAPQNLDCQLGYYACCLKQGDWAQALSCLQALIAMDGARECEYLSDSGRALFEQHKYDEARVTLDKALVRGARPEPCHRTLLLIAMIKGDEALLGSEYVELLKLHPEQSDLHTEYADLLWRQKSRNAAIEHYRRAAALNCINPATHAKLAYVLLSNRDYNGAIAACQQGLQWNPASGKLKTALQLAELKRKQAADKSRLASK